MLRLLILAFCLMSVMLATATAYEIDFENKCSGNGVSTTISQYFGGKPLASGTTTLSGPATINFKSPWGTWTAKLQTGTSSVSTSLTPPANGNLYFRPSLAIGNGAVTQALECNKKHPGDCHSSISVNNGNAQTTRLGLILSC